MPLSHAHPDVPKVATLEDVLVRLATVEDRLSDLERITLDRVTIRSRAPSRSRNGTFVLPPAEAATAEIEMSRLSGAPRAARLESMAEDAGDTGDEREEELGDVVGKRRTMFLARLMDKAILTSRRPFNETLWEVSILLGMPTLARSNNVFIVLSLVLNLIIQTVFCVVLYQRIVGQDQLSPDSFKLWRHTVGQHANMVEDSTWTSMTSRVCERDESLALSTGQNQALVDIYNYLAPVWLFGTSWRSGTALLATALLVWCMVILKEMWACLYFFRTLRTFSLATDTRLQPCIEDDELNFEIVRLSYKRFGFMVFITVYRLSVAAALLVLGSLWLSETTQISEVILNAVAMMFILDVDELLFVVGIPQPTKAFYESIRRVPVKTALRHGVDAPPVMNYLAITILLAAIMWQNHAVQKAMVETREALCGGNKLFAVDVHGPTGLYYSTTTNNFTKNNDSAEGDWSLAVAELIKQKPDELSVRLVTKSMFVYDKHLFNTLRSETMRQRMQRLGTCEDFDPASDEGPAIISSLQRQLHTSTNVTTCDGFAAVPNTHGLSRCFSYSSVLLRASCPVTCGCDRPRGLLLSGPPSGCPRDICEHKPRYRRERDLRVFSRNSTGCVDAPLSELRESKDWNSFVAQLYHFNWGQFEGNALENITLDINASGCAALESEVYSQLLCDPHESHTSLHGFCPQSCGCRRRSREVERIRCPRYCNNRRRRSALALKLLRVPEEGGESA